MIQRKTVLILGAGASQPYGFPTGGELSREICERLSRKNDLVAQIVNQTQISSFVQALELSGQDSIDAFLARRSEYEQIGKMSLAAVLLLHVKDSESSFGQPNSWYQRLFKTLVENCDAIDDFSKNNVSIITYNYEQSLEQYLFLALKNTFGATVVECSKQIEELNIIHLHGHLGKLDWQGGQKPYNIFSFEGSVTSMGVRQAKSPGANRKARELTLLNTCAHEAIENIKVIHEVNIDELPQFGMAHEILNKASCVYFLGFGYGQENIERLNCSDWANMEECKGTAHNLDAQTKHRLNSLRFGRADVVLTLCDNKCYDFLYNDIIFE